MKFLYKFLIIYILISAGWFFLYTRLTFLSHSFYERKTSQGENPQTRKLSEWKTILLYKNVYPIYVQTDDENYLQKSGCPVFHCRLTYNKSEASQASAILFHNRFPEQRPKHHRDANQIWIWHTWESPKLFPVASWTKSHINWTATYRRDSFIDSSYGRFVHSVRKIEPGPYRNYAANKTKMVAWFVSNPRDKNGRFRYAQELSRYIGLDIYGALGNNTCPIEERCFKMLRQYYKFYLAFENANCREYITEKLFHNSLGNDVIPIVMGAPVEDYERIAPPGSFIHVDWFDSPKDLAAYLHVLDQNDFLYNDYFRWRNNGGYILSNFYNRRFHLKLPAYIKYKNDLWCQVCAKLHSVGSRTQACWIDDLPLWWRGNHDVCIGIENWRQKRKDGGYRRLNLFKKERTV